MLRPVAFSLALLGAAIAAHADPAPPPPEASLVVWPATLAAESAAGALSDRAAERGLFEVVDAALVRQRLAGGARVSVDSFLGEVRRNVAAARASLGGGNPQEAIDRVDSLLRDFLVDLTTVEGRETLRDLLVVRARALVLRNDPVGAAADVTLAVRLDPRSGAGIDLSALLPAERALFARATQDAAGAGVGRLVVTHVAPWTDAVRQLGDAATAFGGPTELAVTGATYEI